MSIPRAAAAVDLARRLRRASDPQARSGRSGPRALVDADRGRLKLQLPGGADVDAPTVLDAPTREERTRRLAAPPALTTALVISAVATVAFGIGAQPLLERGHAGRRTASNLSALARRLKPAALAQPALATLRAHGARSGVSPSPWAGARPDPGGAGHDAGQLALPSCVQRSYVGELEIGKRNPSVETMLRVVAPLGISLGEWFGEAGV